MVSPASRTIRGRWSGAGRTLRRSHGAPGLVPGRRQPLPGRMERAPNAAAAGSDSRSPRGLAVLPGPGCSAAPETHILPGALPLTNPVVARPAPLYFSIFPSALPGSCPTLWFQVPSPASDFSFGKENSDPILSPAGGVRDPGRSLVPRGAQPSCFRGLGVKMHFSPVALPAAVWWVLLARLYEG